MQQDILVCKPYGRQCMPPCVMHGSSGSFTEQPCTPTREHSFFHSSPCQPQSSSSQDWSTDCSSDGCSPGAAAVAAAHYSAARATTCTISSSSSLQASNSVHRLQAGCDHCCNTSSSCSSDGCCSTDEEALLPQEQQEQQAHQVHLARFAGYTVLPGSSGQQKQQQRQRQGGGIMQLMLVAMFCICWLSMSSAAILINKHIMVDIGFHFPAAVAALGMAGTSAFSFLACVVLRIAPCTASVSPYFFFTRVLGTAFFTALSFQAGNTAYLYLSVAFVQMLKAFTPVSTMLCAFLFGLERPSARLIAAVCCICIGVCASSLGELNFSAFGVLAMLVSIAAEGLRIVMVQHLLASKHLNPIEAWLYLGPACCIWLAVLIGVSEVHHIQDAHGLAILTAHPWLFGSAALAGFAVNVLAMCVIKHASALTLKVLGICKDVGLVTFSAMLLGEHVAGLQLAGYSLSLLGFGCYNYVKAADASAAGSQAVAAADTAGRQQQQQLLLQGTKGKLPRAPSPLRRKQGMIGTATMPASASPVAAAAAAAAAERLTEPLIPRGVSIKVLV